MFAFARTYGIMFIWRKTYLILIKRIYHMVEAMSIHYSTILSGARSTGKRC